MLAVVDCGNAVGRASGRLPSSLQSAIVVSKSAVVVFGQLDAVLHVGEYVRMFLGTYVRMYVDEYSLSEPCVHVGTDSTSSNKLFSITKVTCRSEFPIRSVHGWISLLYIVLSKHYFIRCLLWYNTIPYHTLSNAYPQEDLCRPAIRSTQPRLWYNTTQSPCASSPSCSQPPPSCRDFPSSKRNTVVKKPGPSTNFTMPFTSSSIRSGELVFDGSALFVRGAAGRGGGDGIDDWIVLWRFFVVVSCACREESRVSWASDGSEKILIAARVA